MTILALLHRTKALLLGETLLGALESPPASAPLGDVLNVSGWAIAPRGAMDRVEVALGTLALGRATLGIERPDVAAVFAGTEGALRSGFLLSTRLRPAIHGTQTLVVRIVDRRGRVREFRRTIMVRAGAPAPIARVRPPGEPRPSFALHTSVSIVIPVHGQWAHTEACLEQLRTTLPAGTVEVIVVDDASRDHTAERLRAAATQEPRLRVITNERSIGFGASCNRGAEVARNETIVFLNNDTLPRAGWLEALVAPLQDPAVGAVGAKLLYPDGSVQEAGGVIFRDGSGWNFGKGAADPDEPIFNFLRDVDYCSGAALATRRRLFEQLGRFDARFAPAYYEDTDYCFTLRARGYRVVYQPASVIVHAEGATSGVDEQSGVKRSQTVNRTAFADKWRATLTAHREPPAVPGRAALHLHAVRDPAARRVLVWAPTLPEWDRESGSRRMFDLLTMLRDRGFAVSLIAESAEGGDRYIAALQQLGVAVYGGAETRWAGSECLADPGELVSLGHFDLALFHFWWIAERHIALVRHTSPSTRVVIDSIDLHFLRQSRSPTRTDGGDDEKLRELGVYRAADGVLTVSATEAAILTDLLPVKGRVHVVPDAESLEASAIPFAQRCGLLFLGNFRHEPNVHALDFLMKAIMPLLPNDLLARHPITLVGTDLTDALIDRCGARRAHVNLVGWVPDVEPYLARARVMLAPITYGAGTKRKLVQSAMIGTPAVSTSVGIEGLPLEHERHVLVADDPQAFADGVVRLSSDRELWERLAEAGRAAIRPAHDREAVRRRFADVIDRLLA